MPGDPDALYVQARKVLLDALFALEEHLDALVLVGAQAIYLHAGDADLTVAPYTTDGDLAIDPARLGDQPILQEALRAANLKPSDQVGRWTSPEEVYVDLLVPEPWPARGAVVLVWARTARRRPGGQRASKLPS